MSIKKIHKDQPETFEFNEKSIQAANKIVKDWILEEAPPEPEPAPVAEPEEDEGKGKKKRKKK